MPIRSAALAGWILLAAGLAGGARGDVSFDEMMAEQPFGERRMTPEEREALQRRLSEERAAEQGQEQRRQEEEARRLEAELRRLAALPLGERLVTARCTACHLAEVVTASRHAWPGWAFTVARMRYWHGAPLAADELAPVIGHLARTQPTDRVSTVVEYALSLGLVLALVFPVVWKVGRRRGRAAATGAEQPR